MGDAVVHPVECAGCGRPLPGAQSSDPVETRSACGSCASTARLVRVHASEELHLHERLDFKVKAGGRGKPVLEVRQGDDLHRDSGVWRSLHRVIDRRSNRYEERIVSAEGVVVRDVSVPLDRHRGHGSDTSRPKAHP